MRERIAQFEVERIGFLNASGQLLEELPDDIADLETIKQGYRLMVLTRLFDARAINLQRTGQLGTFPSSLGQEAVTIGFALAMQKNDRLLPSYREHGALLCRGVTLCEQLLYWGGDERGSDYQHARKDFPLAVPIATQCLHATGVATAVKLRGEPQAVVTVCGDGATSKGDFAEALNVAGVWQLPLLFIVTNNQWAISVPRAAQSHAETLAQKAIAAGIDSVQVDGNDLLAMEYASRQALERARAGGGSFLIEAMTYRMGDHTTADDARRYRDDDEVSGHWQADPLARIRAYLVEHAGWKKADEETLQADCQAELEQAVADYLAVAPQPPEAMFDYLYAELPQAYAAQRQQVIDRRGQEVADE
ncbi:MAG: pyruvate dehydrogenase (acetyl-transferring) E1 component subunit alpha [Gammaproteobacteria bacterium]|nr:MAG: pyruvate dehydrogenase (acetyl-transferring) E1 component subunit alpha [Gammaproteobacteria bacterium]